jgi:hypothetical protein
MFSVIRPDFEVVKEGRILLLVSGYMRFEFADMVYDEKSFPVNKEFEISNQVIVRDMAKILQLEKVLSIIK